MDVPEAVRLSLLQLGILDGSNPIAPFTVLLTAFAVLASRLTGDEDISIATTGENKEPFVLRTPMAGDTAFVDLLARIKKVLLEVCPGSCAHASLICFFLLQA